MSSTDILMPQTIGSPPNTSGRAVMRFNSSRLSGMAILSHMYSVYRLANWLSHRGIGIQ